jgi:para-aminobenzoate synthetase/4-amino-4-deoxychorismate lyase
MSAEHPSVPDFSLIETMRLDEGRIVRRDRHLSRARTSAHTLGTGWQDAAIHAALDAALDAHRAGVWRLRLLVSMAGDPSVTCTAFTHDRDRVWRVTLAQDPVASSDLALRHKTTRRGVYERAAQSGFDDVLLWNERGEITESTIANVAAELDGVGVTPPLDSGLLPGVFRAALLESGELRERVITKADLALASRLWLINSLREWVPASLVQ